MHKYAGEERFKKEQCSVIDLMAILDESNYYLGEERSKFKKHTHNNMKIINW